MTTSATRHQAPADGRTRREGAAKAASSLGARRRAARRQQLAAWLFLAPVAIYLVMFYAYPLYRNLDLSFRDYTLRSFISGDAEFVGLANYRDVLTDPAFGTALWNTVVFTGVSLLFQYAIGLALAVFFFRKFPLSRPRFARSSSCRGYCRCSCRRPSGRGCSTPIPASSTRFLQSHRAQPDLLAHVTRLVARVGAHHQHLDRHPVQPRGAVFAGCRPSPTSSTRPRLSTAPRSGPRSGASRSRLLRPVSAITLLLGLVYTLKVFDIIWVMTRGGPGDSSMTLGDLVVPARLRRRLPAPQPRRCGRKRPHRHRVHLRPAVHPCPAKGAELMTRQRRVVHDRDRARADRASCCSRCTGWSTSP